METAPQDGTPVLMRIEGLVPFVAIWMEWDGVSRWFQHGTNHCDDQCFINDFTGPEYNLENAEWMHIPE